MIISLSWEISQDWRVEIGAKNGVGNSEIISLVQIRGGHSLDEGDGLDLERTVWICED